MALEQEWQQKMEEKCLACDVQKEEKELRYKYSKE
jgi:hypothetical protein